MAVENLDDKLQPSLTEGEAGKVPLDMSYELSPHEPFNNVKERWINPEWVPVCVLVYVSVCLCLCQHVITNSAASEHNPCQVTHVETESQGGRTESFYISFSATGQLPFWNVN